MGHVDHGKTTLIDALRHSDIAASEYGEVTQSIGAFSLITKNKKYITIIDTPGHEIFTEMRNRGVMATDMIILVVSAAEGVQRQTKEVIRLAKNTNVPMIVAVSKMDRNDSDAERVLLELSENDVLVEELGGKIPSVLISAKTGMNLESLVNTIENKIESLNLMESTIVKAQGFVIESELIKKVKIGRASCRERVYVLV